MRPHGAGNGGPPGGKATIYNEKDCWGRSEVIKNDHREQLDDGSTVYIGMYHSLEFLTMKGWSLGNI